MERDCAQTENRNMLYKDFEAYLKCRNLYKLYNKLDAFRICLDLEFHKNPEVYHLFLFLMLELPSERIIFLLQYLNSLVCCTLCNVQPSVEYVQLVMALTQYK